MVLPFLGYSLDHHNQSTGDRELDMDTSGHHSITADHSRAKQHRSVGREKQPDEITQDNAFLIQNNVEVYTWSLPSGTEHRFPYPLPP